MNQSYEVGHFTMRHVISDHLIVIGASLVYAATRWSWMCMRIFPFLGHRVVSLILAVLLVALAIHIRTTKIWIFAGAIALVLIGASGGQDAWRHATTPSLGLYRGPAIVRSDPERFYGAQRVVLEVQGKRFEAIAYGSTGRRLRGRLMGESVWVEGTRSSIRPDRIHWLAPHHVVGSLTLTSVSERWGPGAPLYRSANRIRRVLIRSADVMPDSEASLFLGLIIGDDRNQPESMRDAFRSAGLSHLVAVSGQNVAFVLIALSPLLRRLRTWWRFVFTLGALGWFVILTRIEPSVLRAAAMAALASFAFARGLHVSPRTMLACAVIGLIVIDPMLAWSIGFAMSVGATAGLISITPRLARLIGRAGLPTWCTQPLAATLGAQLGVMPISVVVFHNAPVVGIFANLLAVPVAGLVMLVGLPLALASAVLPRQMIAVVMSPMVLAVRWVWWVAVMAERVSLHGVLNIAGWMTLLIIGLEWRRRGRLRSAQSLPA
jgi:competence protein ComEC